MSMFPGANAQVYYNEDGEPIGWDYPSPVDSDAPPEDDYDTRYFDGEESDDEPDDGSGADHEADRVASILFGRAN